MKRTIEQEALLRGLVEDIFNVRNGAMNKLKAGATDREIKDFAKREEILKLTQEYLSNVLKKWKEYRCKSIPKKSFNNLLGHSLIISASGKSVINEMNSILSNDDNHVTSVLGIVPINPPLPVIPAPKISFSLQNAKVGELYSSELQIQGETEHKKVVIKDIVFPESVGLSALAPDFRNIIGSPLKDGEYKVLVHYQFQDAKLDHPLLDVEFDLFINPDPKSLWQKNEPDPNSPYIKKHEDKDLIQGSDNRTMVAASRRGRSHEHSGTFRDDDFLLASKHGWDILAMADGAGSAKSSRKGSELAVHKSMQYLITALDTQSEKIEQEATAWFSDQAESKHSLKSALYDAFGRAAFDAVKAIEEEAALKNASPKEYSTTLLLAAHKKLPIGNFFAAYWVGDGGVGVYQKGKNVQLLGEVDSGEFAGQTRFLDKQVMTPDDVMKRLQFVITDDFTGLVLMTDGVTDPKFETDNNLASLQKWDDLWVELEPILANNTTVSDELLKWLEFWSPGNHDDRTIAILY